MQTSLDADDVKVLRFCLARVRAWSTEYCLYSTDPKAGLTACDAIVPPRTPTHLTESMTEESMMTEREHEVHSTGVWPVLTELAEPVDTPSILESTDEPPMGEPESRTAEPSFTARPMVPAASESRKELPTSGIAVEERPAAAASRLPSFEPLPSLVVSRPAPQPKTKVARLRLPRIVSQILNDLPTQWQTLAKEIETRVTRDGLRTMMVATSTPGEGATSVSCALACALAEHTSLRVLLVDADFRRPSLTATLHLPARVGIEHHLLERVSLDEVILSCDKPKLDLLPTLEASQTPSLVGGKRFADAMARLRSGYDLVILDFGAVFATGESTTLPDGIDATLVVRDPTKSGPDLLDRLDAHLARHGICSLGVIENGVDA